jgi:hypothetical protein
LSPLKLMPKLDCLVVVLEGGFLKGVLNPLRGLTPFSFLRDWVVTVRPGYSEASPFHVFCTSTGTLFPSILLP